MRILFLAHRIPYPPNKGDKIRSYNMLKYLVRNHDLYLGTLIDESTDRRFVQSMQPLVCEFLYDLIRPRLKRIASGAAVLRSLPLSVSYFYSRKLQREIDALLDRLEIDAVLCYSSPMAEYVFRSKHRDGKLQNSRRIMDFIDVDSHKWAQYAQRTSGLKHWVYRYEAKQLGDYEQKIAEAFDHILVVSEHEKDILLKGLRVEHVSAVSNGVDLEYFHPNHPNRRPGMAHAIVFTGVMDYRPNVEGVAWFVESVFPRIRKDVPGARVYVVGSRPTAEVRRLGRSDGVEVTGFVEDVRDYLAGADVCIAPLRIARGIQNKVLEAMAMGKPVVSTPEALEGIHAVPREDVIRAGGEADFAGAVIQLLQNPWKAREIGAKARTCVEMHYSWDKNLSALDAILSPNTTPAG